MNRKERRSMSKKLGILQYQQTLPLNKKFTLIRENILAGKQKEQEFKERINNDISNQLDQKQSDIIYHLAETMAKEKNISLIDAMEIVQSKYKKRP